MMALIKVTIYLHALTTKEFHGEFYNPKYVKKDY
jgi:hypothetical protein